MIRAARNNCRRIKGMFAIEVGCFACSSVSVCLIPFLQKLEESVQTAVGYLLAAVFWVGLLAGCLLCVWTNRLLFRVRCRAYTRGQTAPQRFPGVLCLSADISHISLYVLILSGIVLCISDMAFHYLSEYVTLPVLSVTLFAFFLHCIADGKNYKIYKLMKEGMKDESE